MNKSMQNHQQRFLVLVSALMAFLVFLSACGNNPANTTSSEHTSAPTAIPSPTVDPALQRQGAMELQTFQQWIALMQQYGGNVNTYQQQYASDQQALNTVTSDTAYQAALKKIQE